MLDERFAILAAAIMLVGAAWYCVDIWRGQVRPNLVTWVLWALAPAIALAAQLAVGVGLESLLTLAIAVGPILVVATALTRRQAHWKVGRFDLVCGTVSVVALILWRLTGDGAVAITFALLADLLAATPTVVKSYRYPQTESSSVFWLGVIGSVITLLTIREWSYSSAAVSVYVLIINLIIATLVSFPRQFHNPALKP